MKVIVTGGGAVGRHLAVDLVERGHEVTLIEQDRALVEKLRAWAPGVDVRFGDACEPSVLEECDASSVDVLVAATGDDEDNLVSSLLAKQEFAVPRVLARVNHPKNEWLFNEQWGVDAEVSPPHILTAMVEEAVRRDPFAVSLRRMEHRIRAQFARALSRQTGAVGDHQDAWDAAMDAAKKAVKLYPASPQDLIELADTQLEAGEALRSPKLLQESVENYNRALGLDSQRPNWEWLRRLRTHEVEEIERKIGHARDLMERF